MTTRRKKTARPEGSLVGKKARVSVDRGGACIVVDDVPAAEAGLVLADILAAFRALTPTFPELREYPDVVPGGPPTHVPDDDEYEDGLGFKMRG